MARLVTKFKYLKPSDRRKIGGYAKYIATREGVEKLDDSQKFLPAPAVQRKAIEKICKNFPELQSLREYKKFLARDIFAQDLLCIYEEQTRQRDDLKQTGREILTEFITHDMENLTVETLLLRLSEQLSQISEKKQYGYLPPELKSLVDEILNELSKDERITALYDRWCEGREQILDIYDEATHERIPLAQNREFRSMKNAIIQAAVRLSQETAVEKRITPKEEYKDDSGESNEETASAEVAEEPKPTDTSAQAAQIPSKSKSHAATLQLFRILAQLLQGSTPQREQDDSRTDRNLRRRTQEKEQAHGLKHS